MLFFLLVSDKLRRLVLRGTPAHVAEPYFDGFDQRISAYVCGVISYAPKGEEKRSKSGKVLSSAVSPIEAVAAEWGFLRRSYAVSSAPRPGIEMI